MNEVMGRSVRTDGLEWEMPVETVDGLAAILVYSHPTLRPGRLVVVDPGRYSREEWVHENGTTQNLTPFIRNVRNIDLMSGKALDDFGRELNLARCTELVRLTEDDIRYRERLRKACAK